MQQAANQTIAARCSQIIAGPAGTCAVAAYGKYRSDSERIASFGAGQAQPAQERKNWERRRPAQTGERDGDRSRAAEEAMWRITNCALARAL